MFLYKSFDVINMKYGVRLCSMFAGLMVVNENRVSPMFSFDKDSVRSHLII